MATRYMTLDRRLWILESVKPSHNAALAAILNAHVLQATSVADLRLRIYDFVECRGLPLARQLFSHFNDHFPQDYENIPTFKSYMDLVSCGWPEDRPFELALLAMAFEVNIVLIKHVNPLFLLDFQDLFAKLFGNKSPPISTSAYTFHLLHYCHESPYMICSNADDHKLNHFGLLVPVMEMHYPDLFNYAKAIMKDYQKKSQNTINMRRKRKKKSMQEIKTIGKEKAKRNRKKYFKKTRKLVLNNTTTNILNHLTEAIMMEHEQDLNLQPLKNEDAFYALNRYTRLMGEHQLPTKFCVVCACKYIPKKVQRLPVDSIPSFILLAAQPWHRTLDVTGEWVLLNDAIYPRRSALNILSANIQVPNISECDIDICLHDLQAGEIPLRSLTSFDTGPIPQSLMSVKLTFAERMFLAVNMTVFNIFRVDSYGARQMPSECKARVSKGHCISFKHSSTNDIVTQHILPHSPNMLPRFMVTSYIGSAESAEQARQMVKKTRQLTLRTEVVHLFAQEYARLNPTKIVHDNTRLREHISGTVPKVIVDMIDYDLLVERIELQRPTFLELDEAMHDDYAKRDQLRPDEQPDLSVQMVHTSGMVLPHLMANGMDELQNVALNKLSGNVLAISTDTRPISDYDEHYFVDNYPNIFIHGVGARPSNVSLEIYLDTIMSRPKTGATTDYSFPFEARNVLLRQCTLKKVCMSVTLQNSSLIPNIRDEDFSSALEAIKSKRPIKDCIQTLLNQLQLIGADLRGTPQRLNRYRQQILCGLYPLFGPFDVWITLNIQESSSQVVLRIAGEQEVPISFEVSDDVPNISRRMQICAENPMAVARFFHIFMKAFLDALLGLPYNQNDLCPTHKGVFGYVQAYMFILEVSGKATGLHAHGQLKVRGLNRRLLLQRFQDPRLIGIYKDYMLATFTQELPNTRFDVKAPIKDGPKNDLIRKRRDDETQFRYVEPTLVDRAEHYMGMYTMPRLPIKSPCSLRSHSLTEDYIDQRLIQIIRECGIHEHSATCAKNGHAGDDADCRMSYPQPMNGEIDVDLDEHFDVNNKTLIATGIDVKLPRDHPFMVSINKWITLALASNTTIHYMSSGREGRTKALYVTDYSTKKPLSTYECIALFRASMQAKRKASLAASQEQAPIVNDYLSSCTIVNRCLNALSAEIIITRYECCADIGEFPDHYSSSIFVPFSGWSYMHSMLGETSNQTFQIIRKNRDRTTPLQTCLVSFIVDYIHLDIPDDKKMTVYEFVAFYKRKTQKKKRSDNKSRTELRESTGDEDNVTKSQTQPTQRKKVGRPKNMRINFTTAHKLHNSHVMVRAAKMRIPYQVGRQYPKRPKTSDDTSNEQEEVYAKYMLSIFKPWSATMPTTKSDADSWWSTLQTYLANCPPWVSAILHNMDVSLDRDEKMTRARLGEDCISSNTMNHADSKFEMSADDEAECTLQAAEAAELLRDLESEMMILGLNLTRPSFAKEEVFVHKGLQGLTSRFNLAQTPSGSSSQDCVHSSASVSEGVLSVVEIKSRILTWQKALNKLLACNANGTDYEMDVDSARNDTLRDDVAHKLHDHLSDPFFVANHQTNVKAQFQETEFRPNWKKLPTPPTILETNSLWHLTKTKAEFAIMVLDHFHKTLSNGSNDQLLAKCLGAPGTGKSQTLLAILWHMSQHNRQDSVATCAFTGGAAMLISTPYTRPMTTCRQFLITLKGPNLTTKVVKVLTQRVNNIQYVFIDEFSFLSFRHLKHIVEQIAVALGERAQKDKPFSGMNMVFFGDYEQLSKPRDHAMYYGARAEESFDPEAMHMWFAHELEQHTKKTSYDPSATYLGRNLWTSIDVIRTLTVQKRQEDLESGRRLLARCEALREESFTPKFFDALQDKAIGQKHGPDLTSPAWSNPLYIVMHHALRLPLDLNEAMFQARFQSKRFMCWRTTDTILGRPLPHQLQLVVDNIQVVKIPKWQYYYEGMPIAFIDNKYFDVGNATNNLGYVFSITLNPGEPPDDITKPYRTLRFLPEYVLVHVPNSRMTQLCPDLPPKVIPMKPERQSKKIRLGDDRYHLQSGRRVSSITITRTALRWIGVHAVTQFFSQGMSLAGRKCIIDLRVPASGGNISDYAQSAMVMLSRHRNDDDWALLHPLWTPGNHIERDATIRTMTDKLRRDVDLKAELRRVHLVQTTTTETKL